MVSYSGTKIVPGLIEAGSKGIALLLLAFFWLSRTTAQPYFNRLYTNHATGSQFTGACPQGTNGGFMATALAVDSSTGTQGLRTVRFDKEGNVLAGTFCYVPLPGFPGKRMGQSAGTTCKVNDNRFVQVGEVEDDTCACLYGFIRVADSNGNTVYYRHIDKPSPEYSRKMAVPDVAFDGQNIVAFCNFQTGATTANYMLVKFDTALNAIWSKFYTPGIYGFNYSKGMIFDGESYLLSGCSNNGNDFWKFYKTQSTVLKLDTAGNQLWTYRSPEMSGPATNIIRLEDGGYVFAGTANGYDKWASYPATNWVGQSALTKLDKDGNFQWETVYDTAFGYLPAETSIKLLALPGGHFLTTIISADSPGTITDSSYATIRRYSADGERLGQHRYLEPVDTPYRAFMLINQPIRLDDGSIVLAGYLDNLLGTAEPPAQRGWLIKLDSSGCMGPGDPECIPVKIDEPRTQREPFVLYPNPNSGQFSLRCNSAGNVSAKVAVYDLNGKTLYRNTVQFAGNTASLNLNLPVGIYLLEMTGEDGYRHKQRLQIR